MDLKELIEIPDHDLDKYSNQYRKIKYPDSLESVGSSKSKKRKLNNGKIVGGEYEYIPDMNSSNFQIHSN